MDVSRQRLRKGLDFHVFHRGVIGKLGCEDAIDKDQAQGVHFVENWAGFRL